MIKNYGPKNPILGCNLGPNKQPPWCPLVWKQNDYIAVQYKDVHELTHTRRVNNMIENVYLVIIFFLPLFELIDDFDVEVFPDSHMEVTSSVRFH